MSKMNMSPETVKPTVAPTPDHAKPDEKKTQDADPKAMPKTAT
jgi:hypothetical protein